MSWRNECLPHAHLVLPNNDVIEHTRTEKCVCNPKVTDLGRTGYGDQGPKLMVKRMIVHNAMDGREDA